MKTGYWRNWKLKLGKGGKSDLELESWGRIPAGGAENLEEGLVQSSGQSSYPWKLVGMRSEGHALV